MGETLGRVHSVESFGSADGPGVRYIVFLKGCNMRCIYCHNPDTWAKCGENDGAKLMTPQEVLKTAMRYKAYWKQTGGITVSGGEALLQIDFVTELFKFAKEKGVKTVIAKAIGTPQKKLLEKVGADKVLMPERDSGQRLAISLVTSNVLEYITVSDKFGIAEIGVVDKWVDKTLQDANIRAKYGINVVAIKRGGDVIVTPPPDIKILETDTLVVIGENANIAKFS